MGTPIFSNDFKQDEVQQVVDRGYSVAGVSARLGGSKYSLYKWVKMRTLSRM